jgi:uncharacterized RDD family membrane protein YckC
MDQLSGAPDASRPAPGGVTRRALALGVDLVAVRALVGAGDLAAIAFGSHDAAGRAFVLSVELVVPPAYFVLGHGTGGQTLGKWLARVRVVADSGERIGYARALGRLLATIPSLALGIGPLVALCRRDRRALHDLLADTRVVRVQTEPEGVRVTEPGP